MVQQMVLSLTYSMRRTVGSTIYVTGDPSDNVYIIVSGQVAIEPADGSTSTPRLSSTPRGLTRESSSMGLFLDPMADTGDADHFGVLKAGDHFGSCALAEFDHSGPAGKGGGSSSSSSSDQQCQRRAEIARVLEPCELIILSKAGYAAAAANSPGERRFEFLKSVEQFASLGTHALYKFAYILSEIDAKRGDVLSHAGETCPALYIVYKGTAAVRENNGQRTAAVAAAAAASGSQFQTASKRLQNNPDGQTKKRTAGAGLSGNSAVHVAELPCGAVFGVSALEQQNYELRERKKGAGHSIVGQSSNGMNGRHTSPQMLQTIPGAPLMQTQDEKVAGEIGGDGKRDGGQGQVQQLHQEQERQRRQQRHNKFRESSDVVITSARAGLLVLYPEHFSKLDPELAERLQLSTQMKREWHKQTERQMVRSHVRLAKDARGDYREARREAALAARREATRKATGASSGASSKGGDGGDMLDDDNSVDNSPGAAFESGIWERLEHNLSALTKGETGTDLVALRPRQKLALDGTLAGVAIVEEQGHEQGQGQQQESQQQEGQQGRLLVTDSAYTTRPVATEAESRLELFDLGDKWEEEDIDDEEEEEEEDDGIDADDEEDMMVVSKSEALRCHYLAASGDHMLSMLSDAIAGRRENASDEHASDDDASADDPADTMDLSDTIDSASVAYTERSVADVENNWIRAGGSENEAPPLALCSFTSWMHESASKDVNAYPLLHDQPICRAAHFESPVKKTAWAFADEPPTFQQRAAELRDGSSSTFITESRQSAEIERAPPSAAFRVTGGLSGTSSSSPAALAQSQRQACAPPPQLAHSVGAGTFLTETNQDMERAGPEEGLFPGNLEQPDDCLAWKSFGSGKMVQNMRVRVQSATLQKKAKPRHLTLQQQRRERQQGAYLKAEEQPESFAEQVLAGKEPIPAKELAASAVTISPTSPSTSVAIDPAGVDDAAGGSPKAMLALAAPSPVYESTGLSPNTRSRRILQTKVDTGGTVCATAARSRKGIGIGIGGSGRASMRRNTSRSSSKARAAAQVQALPQQAPVSQQTNFAETPLDEQTRTTMRARSASALQSSSLSVRPSTASAAVGSMSLTSNRFTMPSKEEKQRHQLVLAEARNGRWMNSEQARLRQFPQRGGSAQLRLLARNRNDKNTGARWGEKAKLRIKTKAQADGLQANEGMAAWATMSATMGVRGGARVGGAGGVGTGRPRTGSGSGVGCRPRTASSITSTPNPRMSTTTSNVSRAVGQRATSFNRGLQQAHSLGALGMSEGVAGSAADSLGFSVTDATPHDGWEDASKSQGQPPSGGRQHLKTKAKKARSWVEVHSIMDMQLGDMVDTRLEMRALNNELSSVQRAIGLPVS
jgi:CRP-like cAMP-binding protein